MQRNIRELSYNNFCSGKTVIIAYSEFVIVAVGIRYAVRMRHIFICGMPGCAVFF